MLSNVDLIARIRELDDRCKQSNGSCKRGKCMKSDDACFSTSQMSLDLRNRLRAREPSHPLLRLFNPPELSDAERASLEWEVQRANEKCKTKKGGCRPPYCIPDGDACTNMSKRVEELRGLLAPVPAGARQASQPSAAPSSSEAQQQRPRRRLSVKTSRKAWEEGTGAASTASTGRGAVSQVSQPSSESAQRSSQSDMPDRRQRPPLPSAPRPNVEAQAVKREASASTTGGDSPPPVADPSRGLAITTPYKKTSYLGDSSLPWFALLPDISQEEELYDPRLQEFQIPSELEGEALEEEIDAREQEDREDDKPVKTRDEYRDDYVNNRARLKAALDNWIKEYDEVLMPAYRNRKSNHWVWPVDEEPPLDEPPAFQRLSHEEIKQLLERGKTSQDIDAIEEERLKQYLEDYARYAERQRIEKGDTRPTARRSSARPASDVATRKGRGRKPRVAARRSFTRRRSARLVEDAPEESDEGSPSESSEFQGFAEGERDLYRQRGQSDADIDILEREKRQEKKERQDAKRLRATRSRKRRITRSEGITPGSSRHMSAPSSSSSLRP